MEAKFNIQDFQGVVDHPGVTAPSEIATGEILVAS